MTIIEYGPDNPHGAGFVGLRIFVQLVDAKPIQSYFSFNGLDGTAIQATRERVRDIHAIAAQESSIRTKSKQLVAESKSPISSVLGINIGVSGRHKLNGGYRYEVIISVSNRKTAICKSGSIARYSKSQGNFNYEWFVLSWRKACKDLARSRDMKRTPSRWLDGVASEAVVRSFISSKIVEHIRRMTHKGIN